jgi:hypothetical protein
LIFRALDVLNALCQPQIVPDPKTQFHHNVSHRTFSRIRIGPT